MKSSEFPQSNAQAVRHYNSLLLLASECIGQDNSRTPAAFFSGSYHPWPFITTMIHTSPIFLEPFPGIVMSTRFSNIFSSVASCRARPLSSNTLGRVCMYFRPTHFAAIEKYPRHAFYRQDWPMKEAQLRHVTWGYVGDT